jgi:hypothetical protein
MDRAHSSRVTSFDPKMGKSIAKFAGSTRNGVKKKGGSAARCAGRGTHHREWPGLEERIRLHVHEDKKGRLSDFEVR